MTASDFHFEHSFSYLTTVEMKCEARLELLGITLTMWLTESKTKLLETGMHSIYGRAIVICFVSRR